MISSLLHRLALAAASENTPLPTAKETPTRAKKATVDGASAMQWTGSRAVARFCHGLQLSAIEAEVSSQLEVAQTSCSVALGEVSTMWRRAAHRAIHPRPISSSFRIVRGSISHFSEICSRAKLNGGDSGRGQPTASTGGHHRASNVLQNHIPIKRAVRGQ